MHTHLFDVCSKPALVLTIRILNSRFPVEEKNPQNNNYNRGHCPPSLWELSLPRTHEKSYHIALTRKFLGVL